MNRVALYCDSATQRARLSSFRSSMVGEPEYFALPQRERTKLCKNINRLKRIHEASKTISHNLTEILTEILHRREEDEHMIEVIFITIQNTDSLIIQLLFQTRWVRKSSPVSVYGKSEMRSHPHPLQAKTHIDSFSTEHLAHGCLELEAPKFLMVCYRVVHVYFNHIYSPASRLRGIASCFVKIVNSFVFDIRDGLNRFYRVLREKVLSCLS